MVQLQVGGIYNRLSLTNVSLTNGNHLNCAEWELGQFFQKDGNKRYSLGLKRAHGAVSGAWRQEALLCTLLLRRRRVTVRSACPPGRGGHLMRR